MENVLTAVLNGYTGPAIIYSLSLKVSLCCTRLYAHEIFIVHKRQQNSTAVCKRLQTESQDDLTTKLTVIETVGSTPQSTMTQGNTTQGSKTQNSTMQGSATCFCSLLQCSQLRCWMFVKSTKQLLKQTLLQHPLLFSVMNSNWNWKLKLWSRTTFLI